MIRLFAPVLAATGVYLIVKGNLGGIMMVVVAILLRWPELTLISWPRSGEQWDLDPGDVEPTSRPSRRRRLVLWAWATCLLWTLIVGVGMVGYFLLGAGSVVGLLIGATAVVLSIRALDRLEPRTG